MKKPIQIGAGGIYHETNSFAPGKTVLENFKTTWIDDGKEFISRYDKTKTSMGGAIDAAKSEGVELIPGLYTDTTPSGMVTGDAIEILINSLIYSIPKSVDGIILFLHGAMVSETYPDVEAEILTRLRRRFGESIPIVVTLDLHANTSENLVKQSTSVVGYNT